MSTERRDAVDAVILGYLDYRDGTAARPTLDHLDPADRDRADELLRGLAAARGMDPRGARPSVEALLADTPLGGLLPIGAVRTGPPVGLATLATLLGEVELRARVEVDPDGPIPTVVYSYLDLRVRFLLVEAATPVIDADLRAAVAAVFSADPDTNRVAVVAGHSDDLATQVLAADEVGDTITAPRGEPLRPVPAPLPLTAAIRQLVEQGAPEWPAFDFDQAWSGALEPATIAADIARRVIARESARSYRGDKRRAYQGLVGREQAFADLVARVCAPGTTVDLDQEISRISGAAA